MFFLVYVLCVCVRMDSLHDMWVRAVVGLVVLMCCMLLKTLAMVDSSLFWEINWVMVPVICVNPVVLENFRLAKANNRKTTRVIGCHFCGELLSTRFIAVAAGLDFIAVDHTIVTARLPLLRPVICLFPRSLPLWDDLFGGNELNFRVAFLLLLVFRFYLWCCGNIFSSWCPIVKLLSLVWRWCCNLLLLERETMQKDTVYSYTGFVGAGRDWYFCLAVLTGLGSNGELCVLPGRPVVFYVSHHFN